jgi:hypothetical protein
MGLERKDGINVEAFDSQNTPKVGTKTTVSPCFQKWRGCSPNGSTCHYVQYSSKNQHPLWQDRGSLLFHIIHRQHQTMKLPCQHSISTGNISESIECTIIIDIFNTQQHYKGKGGPSHVRKNLHSIKTHKLKINNWPDQNLTREPKDKINQTKCGTAHGYSSY